MPAPRNPDALAAYIDELERALREKLELQYVPIFCITAECNAALNAGALEWSFGAGGAGTGVVLPFRCALFALSLNLTGGTARAKVDVVRDGTNETAYALDLTASNFGSVEFPKPLEFFTNSTFNFRTVTQANTAAENVVAAWMRRG